MSIRPSQAPKEVRLSFEVDVSNRFIESYIEQTGSRPGSRWTIEFKLDEVPAHLRVALIAAHDRYLEVEPFPMMDDPTDDPEQFLAHVLPWLESVEKLEAEENAAAQEANAAQKAFDDEMKGWSEVFGSRRLKAALAGGYKANTTYAIERAEHEVPGFWVDTAGDMEWGERSDPTLGALDLQRQIRARLVNLPSSNLEPTIVWLKEAPRALDRLLENESLEQFEPQEAIIALGYLGRYAIVLPVDEELRHGSAQGSV